jgi:hypothetical protein
MDHDDSSDDERNSDLRFKNDTKNLTDSLIHGLTAE